MPASDGRKDNGGRGDGLTAKLIEARDAAPNGADSFQIITVARAAFDRQIDAEDVWREVDR